MTLQQLEYIVAVEKYRQFVRAAAACGVTQSTLSALVQKLEQELDVVIFDRNAHPVCPTPLGLNVLEQARRVLAAAEQLRENVRTMKGDRGGRVKLGVASTIAPYVLPSLFEYNREHHPEVQILAEEGRLPILEQKLEQGEIEVALTATPLRHPSFLEIPIYHEPFVAYVSPTNALYEEEWVDAKEMPQNNLWVLREAYCPKQSTFAFCHRKVDESSYYEAGSVETLIRIVDLNGGYAVIPELHIPLLTEEQQKNIRRFGGEEPKREVSLVIQEHFVREGMLNVLADALKHIIPQEMLVEKIKRYAIKL